LKPSSTVKINHKIEIIEQNGDDNSEDEDEDEPSTVNYICSVCPYKRSNFTSVQQHLSIHLTGQGVVCPLCSYTTSTNNSMMRHMTTMHPTSQPIIQFPLATRITTANIIEQHQCPICSYHCERSEALDLHRRLVHDDEEFDIDSSSSVVDDDETYLPVDKNNNIFQCPLCTPTSNTNNYSNLEQFTLHVFTNHLHNNQSCPFCSYLAHTTSTYTLLEHIKLHFNGTLVQPDSIIGIENVKELLME
jgi:rubrerythrin